MPLSLAELLAVASALENVEADNNDGNSLSNNVLVARIGTLLTPTVAGRANSTGIISFDDCGELLERKQRPAGSW